MPEKRPLIITLKNLTSPLVVMLILVGCVRFYLGRFEESYFVLLVLSFLLAMQLVEGIDFESNNKTFWKKTVARIILQWFWLINLLLLIGFASKMTDIFSRKVLFSWFLITPVALVTAHWLIRFLLHRWSIIERGAASAAIIGINNLSLKLASQFKQNPLLGMALVGFFEDRQPERFPESWQQQPETLLGTIEEAAKIVKSRNIQHIYIALPVSAQPRILALLDSLRDTTASIYFALDISMFDLTQAHISTIKGIPVVAICNSPFVGINGIIKRIVDVVLSLIILVLIAPLMLLIAIAVKLSSRGPVFFKQHRYGLDGKEIVIYKFRSMTVLEDGERVAQATRSDPRITRIGNFLRKTSLDELPQFINVLQGRMSIVGPRPHAISHNEMYRSLIKGYMIRHKVKPGITGWAQVNGFRGETDTLEKMQARIDYDLDYLSNCSLFLDLLIIFRTIKVVFKDKNAY